MVKEGTYDGNYNSYLHLKYQLAGWGDVTIKQIAAVMLSLDGKMKFAMEREYVGSFTPSRLVMVMSYGEGLSEVSVKLSFTHDKKTNYIVPFAIEGNIESILKGKYIRGDGTPKTLIDNDEIYQTFNKMIFRGFENLYNQALVEDAELISKQ